MNKDPLTLAGLCLSAITLPALADTVTNLDTVTVSATRNAQTIQHSAPNISVLNRTQLDQQATGNIEDILQDEPGVSVATDPARRGHNGPTIRGMDGNRILMLIDGQRLPDSYSGGGGNGAISGRDYVEPDTLKQVDIVKGPHSALYGSDAIGGLINYTTWSPLDFISPEKQLAGALRHSYGEHNKGHATTATLAAGNEQVAGLLMLTQRRFHQTDNLGENNSSGSSRTTPNPQLGEAQNILAKLQLGGNGRHQLELTAEKQDKDVNSDVINAQGASRSGILLSQNTIDTLDRQRLSAEYRYRPVQASGLTAITAKAFQQQLRNSEHITDLGRNTSALLPLGPTTRLGQYQFDQDIRGVDGQAEWQFGEHIRHHVTAGLELTDIDTSRRRDNLTTYSNGTSSNVYAGESFPSKSFPDSQSRRSGLYLQDAIRLGSSGGTLTPAIRYDRYSLRPTIDAEYLRSNPSGERPGTFTDSAVSPRLGFSQTLSDTLQGFVTLSSGFRAPPFDSAMMAFRNTTHGYEILPNSNLKSERSRGIELGLKHGSDALSGELTIFHNQYRDFIERQQVGSRLNNGRPFYTYQHANIGKVATHGIEMKTRWQIDPHWQLAATLAYARGNDKSSNKPLNSIDPLKTTLAARYQQESWGGELQLNAASAKTRTNSDNQFKAPGYGVVDASTWYRAGKQTVLRAAIRNIGNKRYWQWADTKDMSGNSIDFYSQPGRHITASIETRF